MVKIGPFISEYMIADRQTHRHRRTHSHAHHNTPLSYRGRRDKAIVDIRLRPRSGDAPGGSVCVYATVTNPCCFLLSHYCVAYSWPLCTNMTSSTKPEVHNVSQRPQSSTDPQTWVTRTKTGKDRTLWFRRYTR